MEFNQIIYAAYGRVAGSLLFYGMFAYQFLVRRIRSVTFFCRHCMGVACPYYSCFGGNGSQWHRRHDNA